MAATCAACLKPITGAFVLHGTEVFHKTQVCVSRLASSMAHRQARVIEELRAQIRDIEGLRELATRVERQAAEAIQSAEYWRNEADRLRRNDSATIELVAEQALVRSLRRQLEAEREASGPVDRRLRQAEADRDAAKRELALHQQIAGQQATPAATDAVSDTSATKAESKDPLSIRTGLLELD